MIMKQPEFTLKKGTHVLTHPELETITGMMVSPVYLAARKVSASGTVMGVVPGHGGDVYWVNHGNGENPDVAVYCFTEFEFDVN
jgi:hypothetical protein